MLLNAQDLSAGEYEVTVTDDRGCQAFATVVIEQGDEIISTIDATAVQCYSDSNGVATITSTGGTGALSYTWATGDTTTTITDLQHGDYWVIVTDDLGCSVLETAHIDEPSPLLVTATPTDVSCHGGSDGMLSSFIEGGTAPYNYYWEHEEISTTPLFIIYLLLSLF